MPRLLLIVLIGLLLSCSILEDTDVTSYTQFSNLKLTEIQIIETRNNTTTTKLAPVAEEIMDETLPSGIRLTKRKTITWPSTTKFKFRSGAANNITIVCEYMANGKIKYWKVKSAGIELETYEFLYNQNGFVNFLRTTIKTNVDGTITTQSYDEDTYDPKEYNFPISRNLNSANLEIKAGFGGPALSVNNCGYSFVWQTAWNATTKSYNYKKEYIYCDQNNFYIVKDGGGQGGRSQFQVIANELLEEVYMGETQNNDGCCADVFYFHPYLFMNVDHRIRVMYAPDWWKEDNTFNGDTRQSIRLKFNYEL